MTNKVINKDKPILAWKGFNKVDSKTGDCRGHAFKEGVPYSVNGQAQTCNNGFHACVKPNHVFGHYPYDKNGKIYSRVKLWGDTHADADKIAATHIEVSKFISADEFKVIVDKEKNKRKEREKRIARLRISKAKKAAAKRKIAAEKAKLLVNVKPVLSFTKSFYSEKSTLINKKQNAYVVTNGLRNVVSEVPATIMGNFRSIKGVNGTKFVFTNGRIVTVGKDGIKANTKYELNKGKLTIKAA